jgi:hypothetical protein
MYIDQLKRLGSERYIFQKNMIQDGLNSFQKFNDDEDFIQAIQTFRVFQV